jgi:hypothetical protein
MNRSFKMTAIACSALAAATFLQANDAEARRGRVAAGVITGLVVGGLIAGAASSARASEHRYYSRSSSYCRDLRRQAVYNEEIGRPRRAAYYWDRYAACRGD